MTLDITKSVTDDFCEAFQSESDYQGFVARMVASEILPDGVNPDDERVQVIIQKCKAATTVRPVAS